MFVTAGATKQKAVKTAYSVSSMFAPSVAPYRFAE